MSYCKNIFIVFLAAIMLLFYCPKISIASDNLSEKTEITEFLPNAQILHEENLFEQEDTNWFSKYKWYILLGIIIVAGAAAAASGGGGGSSSSEPIVH